MAEAFAYTLAERLAEVKAIKVGEKITNVNCASLL